MTGVMRVLFIVSALLVADTSFHSASAASPTIMIDLEGDSPRARGMLSIARVEGENVSLNKTFGGMFIKLGEVIQHHTDIRVSLAAKTQINSTRLHDLPVVILAVDEKSSLTPGEQDNISRYFEGGGLLFIDNLTPSSGTGHAKQLFLDIVADALPEDTLIAPLDDTHPLYSVYFELAGPPRGLGNRLPQPRDLLAVTVDGRLVALFSNMGYTACWHENSVGTMVGRFGVNLVLYAASRIPPD
jgi:hypothetical protein